MQWKDDTTLPSRGLCVLMTAWGQTRSFGDIGSMSGLPESGPGWAIYECAVDLRATGCHRLPATIPRRSPGAHHELGHTAVIRDAFAERGVMEYRGLAG